MSDKPIRVGFIGLNPGIHWAATAPMPALKALPHAFESAQARVNSPEIDLVVDTIERSADGSTPQ